MNEKAPLYFEYFVKAIEIFLVIGIALTVYMVKNWKKKNAGRNIPKK